MMAAAALNLVPGLSLTKKQIEDFFEVGFVVVDNVFSKSEIDEIGAALNRITEMAKSLTQTTVYKGAQFVVEGSRIDRVVWCGAAEPILLNYGEDNRILNPVSQLLGTQEMQQLICQFHPKLPGDTVKFDWHQDSQHRFYGTSDWTDVNGKGSYVQTMLAIDEVSMENGPVFFIPGSGKNGHLGLDKNPVEQFCDLDKAVPCLMKPGSLAFFGPYVVHGSFPNESNKSRRVFLNGYAHPQANKRAYPGVGSGRFVSVK